MGMRNDVQNAVQGGGGSGFIPTSFKAMSSYLRIVSSGASSVASTVKSAASAASAMVDRDSESNHDQVQWAGFDKLECEGGLSRLVLLLGYRRGFQVWDVEDDNNVRNLVSRQDGSVSVLQLLPKPLASKQSGDKFANSRPMLILCADECLSGGPYDGTIRNDRELPHGGHAPTVVWFYSLTSHSYVHMLKFRSVVHMVRCSSRVIAVLQATQIHCFDAATLEKDYTILTHPVMMNSEAGGLGVGPLAVGPRWMAYSGSPVDVTNYGRVSPQQLTPASSFPGLATNGSLVAHYAKESTKQIAAGIVTLGDMGYKKLSRYCSELLPDGGYSQAGNPGLRVHKAANGQFLDADNIGMVIVRDTVKKAVITQFRAHKSPISSLCFDPSGTLLVTASVQGHNINVFRIIPGFSENSSGSDSAASYIHLYRLQRGFTNAVIQDISFSRDSDWILISSSRGTSHLFAISLFGVSDKFPTAEHSAPRNSGLGSVTGPPFYLNPQTVSSSTGPITLSVVSRIRSGNNGWRQAVSGATAVAAGRMKSLSVAVAAAFHNFNGSVSYPDACFLKANNNLLVFSSPGFLIQHAWRISSGVDFNAASRGVGAYEAGPDTDARVVVEAIRKWNISHKQNYKGREENIDIYGENGSLDRNKVFPEGMEKPEKFGIRPMVLKDKPVSEERYHMFIAEAELHMHDHQSPLWAKSGMQFQTMVTDGMDIDEEDALGGEIEIERIPVRIIEANSKELVPVFDYLQAPKIQLGSCQNRTIKKMSKHFNNKKTKQEERCKVSNKNEQFLATASTIKEQRCNSHRNTQSRMVVSNGISDLHHHKSRILEGSKLSSRGSSGSLGSLTDSESSSSNNIGVPNDLTKTGRNGLQLETNNYYVNNNDHSPEEAIVQLGFVVNNRENCSTEMQFVNSNNIIACQKGEESHVENGDAMCD